MQTITCDVCKKKVDNPITDRTFFYFAEHNVCEACRDNMEAKIKSTVRTKDPFSYEWYNKIRMDVFGKTSSRGR